jgi:hypothetical protein
VKLLAFLDSGLLYLVALRRLAFGDLWFACLVVIWVRFLVAFFGFADFMCAFACADGLGVGCAIALWLMQQPYGYGGLSR